MKGISIFFLGGCGGGGGSGWGGWCREGDGLWYDLELDGMWVA